jgi:uncharacterized protein DUF4349
MKTKLGLLGMLILVICIGACSENAANKMAYESDSFGGSPIQSLEADMASPQMKRAAKAAPSRPGTGSAVQKQNISLPVDRKIIRTGHINYHVDTLENIETAVEASVKTHGGYIASSQFDNNYGQMTIKVPADQFDSFVKTALGFGKVIQKNVNSQDVTEEYMDVELRLKNKRALQDRIRSYLAKTYKIDDLIRIERELARITIEIDQMSGRLKYLDRQVSYSTLTLNFSLPYVKTLSHSWPSVTEDLKEFVYDSVHFLSNLLIMSLYIILYGVFIVIGLGLVYWITFGRLGYVKKFFIMLSVRKVPKDK